MRNRICKLSAWKCEIYVRTIGLYWFGEEIGSGCTFCLRDTLTRGLLLGLLGWREKRGFVSPLSQSPLVQPLVPGSDREKDCLWGWAFYLWSRHPEPPKRGRVAGPPGWRKETRGWVDYNLPLFGNAMTTWDLKLGNVGSGRKIYCHV
jgi:hypothetical protein